MECRDIEILVQMNIDHCLPEALRPELEAHLAACPACAQYAAELQQLDAMLAAEITHVAPPEGFTAAVMAALPALPQAQQQQKHRPRRAAWGLLSAVAAACLLLTAGLAGWFEGLFGDAPLAAPPVIAESDDDQPGNEVYKPVLPEENAETQLPPVISDPQEEEEEQPEEDPEELEPPETYSEELDLPRVATNTTATGEYAIITLGYCETCDAILPRVSGEIVTYYMEDDGKKLEYQVPLDGSSQPELVGRCESLPSPLGMGQKHTATIELQPDTEATAETDTAEQAADAAADAAAENSNDSSMAQETIEITYYTAVSPSGLLTAINRPDGFYVQKNADSEPELVFNQGGGLLVCWSPDGNKVFFSSADGKLHLYYPAEGTTLTIPYTVHSACWSGNQYIVFAADDAVSGYTSIFRATVP